MATREYPRTLPMFSEPHLDTLLDAALGMVGCHSKATETTIQVTHASLTASHDAAIAGVFAGYVFDPEFGGPPPIKNLKTAIPALRGWANDAIATVDLWDGLTTARRFAEVKVVITRFGVLSDRLADLLAHMGFPG